MVKLQASGLYHHTYVAVKQHFSEAQQGPCLACTCFGDSLCITEKQSRGSVTSNPALHCNFGVKIHRIFLLLSLPVWTWSKVHCSYCRSVLFSIANVCDRPFKTLCEKRHICLVCFIFTFHSPDNRNIYQHYMFIAQNSSVSSRVK